MKFIQFVVIASIFLLLISQVMEAQFPYRQSFKNTSVPGLVVSGVAKLTAATGIDPDGQGYLRLTDNTNTQVGYVYAQDSFPAGYGLTTSFEFFSYKSDAAGYNQADGINFFLFDASVNAFRPGGVGGSLGYAQYYTTPGMAKGYLGIGIDEFGNYSSATDGSKNGGPGQKRGSVVIRGPGNGRAATDYVYQTGVAADDPLYSAGFLSLTQRYPDSTTANYRRLKIILTPGSSLGADKGYKITVVMYKGGNPVTPITLINNFDYPFIAPAQLQFGLAASTGAITDFHEIRNMNITPTNTSSLVAPTAMNDSVSVCPGQQAILDVTANDLSNNNGGSINKATVDLDPATAGQQTSFTDAGKGSYTVDNNGLVTFTAENGFTGNSVVNYKVNDNYGITAANSATITVNVNGNAAPALTISNPSPVCAPALVNITNSALRTSSTPGASYDYFLSVSDAYNNTNNINATANAIATGATYYIRASAGGCATVKPVTVQIDQPPTASNAGPDQNSCASTGALNTTLLGSNPDVGSGTWSQVSGPSAANITFPNASTSPVYNLQKGVYVLRWTISNGACAASTDDLQISVGVPSNAGSTQTFANGGSGSLQGNDPTPGTGRWTQVSGPTAAIMAATDPNSTVGNLVPGNTYVFRWTVTNGGCITSSQVTLNDVLNTTANAGADQVLNNVNQATLNGNLPDAGNTGIWSLVSAPPGSTPSITQAANAQTSVTSLNVVGDYVFRWTISNGSFSNSDDVKVTVLSLLPVNIISFTASQESHGIVLNWRTATELNNDHFVVERSVDGTAFSRVAEVAGKGNSSLTNSYTYLDHVNGIAGGSIFYRLQQVDINGRSSYTGILTLGLNAPGAGFIAWPNPFIDRLDLRINFTTAGMARFRLYNNKGDLLRNETRKVTRGINNLVVDQLGSYAPGLFIIEVEKDATMFRQKIIKN